MTHLAAFFRPNPIIVKEIRSRMRGPRAFITITIILVVMGAIMYGTLQLILASARYSTVLSPQIGQTLFAALAFLELFMICTITPAVTAGAISGEKEKQTYEMLMSTPLSPTSILWGKLISALSYVLLLVFAGIPLASIVFIFGGVAPRDMLKALLVLLVVAISYGILGLFLSALFGRTGRATVASFLIVLVFMVGPLFLAAIIGSIRGGEPPRWILIPSPVSALSAALAPTMGIQAGGNLFYILSGLFNIGVAPISQTSIPRPMYHYTLPFYAVLSLVLYMLTTRLILTTRRWRIPWKQILVGAATLLVVIGLIVGGYLLSASRYEWAVNTQGVGVPTMAPAIAVPAPAIQKPVIVGAPEEATPTPVLPGTTATPSASMNTLDEEAQVEIYAAVVRQFYTVDHTFGNNPPNWQSLYLVSTTNNSVGDPNAAKDDPMTFSKPLITGIAQQLSDLPAKILWVETKDKVVLDPQTGQVENGKGAIITFGNIHAQPDGTVHVSSSLYFANLGASGKTYILSKVDGVWKVTGKTGVEWKS